MLTLTHPTITTNAPAPKANAAMASADAVNATTTSKPALSRTSLSVAQVLVLSTAAQRPDHMVLPLPATLRLRGRGQTKLLAALLEGGLVEEVPVADDALCWRRDADDQRIGLRVTEAGLTAIQAPSPPPPAASAPAAAPASRVAQEPKAAHGKRRKPPASAVTATDAPQAAPASTPDPEPASAPTPATAEAEPVHPSGKLGQVLSAVSGETGATLTELVSLTGWQAHTARAALTGLRRRGFPVQLSEQLGRKAYRLDAAE